MIALRIAAILLLCGWRLFGHTGEGLRPHDLWSAWRFEPGVLTPMAISAVLYARGAKLRRGATGRQMFYFWSGWLMVAIALLSPLHPLGEALFCAHMLQHEVLMLCAAPLLVLSRPLAPMLWGLPFNARRRAGRWSKSGWVKQTWVVLTAPFVAWWVHAFALWIWHAPALFQATLSNEWVHAAQHSSFFLSALLFWWSLFYARGQGGYGAAVLYVFTTAIHTSILGALLTFANTVWYPEYRETVSAWGLTALEDQQIGGLIMWVPAGLVYLAAGLVLCAGWMRQSDRLAMEQDYAG